MTPEQLKASILQYAIQGKLVEQRPEEGTGEELYQQIEAEGVDRATADQMIQETYGCTAQEYMTQLLQQSIDVDSLLDEIESTGGYEARGEKLFMADPGEEISANQYDLFKVDGDTLTLSLADDSQDPEVLPGLDYPLVFTRQQ